MPAVAVIRKRLVLFIRIRFKGYLDGLNVSIVLTLNGTLRLELYVRGQNLRRRDHIH